VASFLDIFSASNGVFSIFCHGSHINNLDIFSVFSQRLIFTFCLMPHGKFSPYYHSLLRVYYPDMLSGVSWSDSSVVCRATVNYPYIFSGVSLWIISEFCRKFHGEFSRDFVLRPPVFFGVWRRIVSIFHLASHGEQSDIVSDVSPSIN
jgi:hypothetical protein